MLEKVVEVGGLFNLLSFTYKMFKTIPLLRLFQAFYYTELKYSQSTNVLLMQLYSTHLIFLWFFLFYFYYIM